MKRLLILGGNRYNLLGIQAARNAGFYVMVADRNRDAAGFAAADVAVRVDVVDVDELLKAIEKLGGVDGIVSMAEVGVRVAAELSARLGLPSITREAAANATSKAAMRKCWAKLGRYSPDFRVIDREDLALRLADELNYYPLICKPDRSLGGSRGVRRVDCRDEMLSAFQFAKSAALPNSDVVIEKCVEGTEHSVEVLIWQGKTSVLCIGEKVKSPPPYRVDLSVQYPAALSPDQEAEVESMCDAAVREVGLTQGAAHVEFAYTDGGPVLFELGARCGGGHTPQIAAHVSGVDEFIECCRMACGEPPTKFRPITKRGADYRFIVLPAGRLKSIYVPEDLRNRDGLLDVAVTALPGTHVGNMQSTSDRSGFVVTLASDRTSAAQLADRACERISVDYSDRRSGRPHLPAELRSPLRPQRTSVLSESDENRVMKRYRDRIVQKGITFDSMASGTIEKQNIRHEIHASAIRTIEPSILDIGCGLAQFLQYLNGRGIRCRYTGYDIVPEYVAYCRDTFPYASFERRNIFCDGIHGMHDTIVMSQVLNNRYEDSDNLEVIKTAIAMAYEHTRYSVSIDMMSSYVDFQNPELFYYSPEEVFRFAKTVSRRVIMRHDHRPFEFCIQLFHDDAPGFVL